MTQRCDGVEIHGGAIAGIAVKDNVSTATIGKRLHAVGPVIAQVVDDSIRAKLLDKLKFVLTTHEANDLCAGRLSNLYDQRPHCPGCGMHHDPLIGFHLGGAVHQQPCGISAG